MKLARRTRTPATDERTTSVPCPWRRSSRDAARAADTAPDVIGAGELHGTIPARLIGLLVAEATEGQHHDIDVSAGERGRGVQHFLMTVGVVRVEGQGGDLSGTRRPDRGGRRGQSVVMAAGQHHGGVPGWRQAGCDGHADLGGAAEYEDGLDCTEGVFHGSSPASGGSSNAGSRRARSETSRRCGSTRSRTARQAGRAGYMPSSSSGRRRASLAR